MAFEPCSGEMLAYGAEPSVIRETFEYGCARAAEIGKENVFDFSLGNPSVPPPDSVHAVTRRLLDTCDAVALHGYTSGVGAEPTRKAVADNLNARFHTALSASNIYMTCGAAASLTVTMHALLCEGDELISFAPYFPEYRVFAQKAGAKFVPCPADTESFQPNLAALADLITERTKICLINTPNNPTGVIYTEGNLRKLCDILRAKEREYGHPIYLVSDEPYRELVYDEGAVLPYLMNLYDDTFVCYSFSKSLSLPGERIGYIAVSPKLPDSKTLYTAICGAGRALGYVCAPSLMQRVIAENLNATADLAVYKENRDILYGALSGMGYDCVHPDGAFYLWMRSPEPDANAFCRKARKYELLLVPSDSFGCEGFVRISYCVSTDMIKRSLKAFEALIREYR